jgi:phytoene dehydrogenase-like protein
MSKSIAIIGAGIAGLSAGCYGRMNGFDTTIFELHDKPGGLCTAWERDGYTIDGCIQWLCGSSPRNRWNKNWRELGALPGAGVVDFEEFVRVESPEGKTLIVYTDVDRFEKHLLELSPADRPLIREFTNAVRYFARMDAAMARENMSWSQKLGLYARLVPFFYRLMTGTSVSIQQFSARFQDPFLKRYFKTIFDIPDFPLLGAYFSLGMMHNRAAGYPLGGSLEFSRRIERRYRELGGDIRYNSRVAKILVEDGKAVGVRLVDGTELRADYVISAADGHATLFDMLGEQYLDKKALDYFKTLKPFPPLVYIGVGLDMNLGDRPHSVICYPDAPLSIPGVSKPEVYFRHYCYDPSMAPTGKSALIALFSSDYAVWKEIAADPSRYEAEKRAIADQFIRFLDQRFPGAKDHVEMIDVATPMTFERYTGNWQGSFEGWLITTKSIKLRMRKTLPSVANFHMIGQWVQPGGGVPTGAIHGQDVIKKICRENRLKFQTTEGAN